MKEILEIKLSPDGTSVQLIGSLAVSTIQFPETVDDLLKQCGQALQKYYENHKEYKLFIDFQEVNKIASIGFSVLEADIQDFALRNKAQLKFINFPTTIKPSLETRALYYRLNEQDGIHFQN
ncbi:hypothetical protein [Candidatus Parabeggiatoa sp. HSG14]|uniref:hypothetical protein n=1 Tax=Candidatus Parabeggiatoa sp. HSG14 TaxID=3055593 RepID=UPI0025A7F331|nr:hypothetical protein [Thiotrichales bacterium HSG14]